MVLSVPVRSEEASEADPSEEIVERALAFLGALDAEERTRASFPFDSAERFEWSYLPGARKGVSLGAMGAGPARAAGELLAASLSVQGLAKVETIRRLERVLFARSGWSARDSGRYFLALFGDPHGPDAWGWRFEGHHVSLHWTVLDGRIAASAPQFLGANPAEVRDGALAGTRVLAREEDLGRALVRSLDEGQRILAVASATAPRDILSGMARAVPPLERLGVPGSALSDPQRALLLELAREYASVQPAAVAAARMARVERELPDLRFLWMGGLEPGQGHYYRLQGATFLVEYDNTQDGANHVHSVWRDLDGDWGRDLLAEHYRTSPHHAAVRGRGAASR